MKLRMVLTLCVVGLLASASGLVAAGGQPQGRTPVGTWVAYNTPHPDSPGDPMTSIEQFHRSGTADGTAWSDPVSNVAGAWKKVAGNRYRSTRYVMIPDAGGILRLNGDFWMLSKDEMEGYYEILYIPGDDPLADPVVVLFWGTTSFSRIKVAPMGLP